MELLYFQEKERKLVERKFVEKIIEFSIKNDYLLLERDKLYISLLLRELGNRSSISVTNN